MSRPSIPRGWLIAPLAGLPLLLGPGAELPDPGPADAIRYTVHIDAGSSEPWIWDVVQGPEIVEVRERDGMSAAAAEGAAAPPMMLAGAALGGTPHTVDADWGLLIAAWGDPPQLEGGTTAANGYGTVAAYDSVRFSLVRGDRDDAVEGRSTEHWVLSATAWSRPVGEGQEGTRLESTARADLWFDPELRFTAVPFALARSVALPLAQVDLAAANYVRYQAMSELGERGLLVRAETSTRQLQHVDWQEEPLTLEPNNVVVTVGDVEAAPETPRADDYVPRYARLDADRAEALELASGLAFACDAAAGLDPGSSFEGQVAGRRVKGGSALGADPFPLTLTLATDPERADVTCLVVLGAGAASAGTLPVAALDAEAMSAGQPPDGSIWVAAFGRSGELGSRRVMVAESGELEIRSVASGRAGGAIRLEGWEVDKAGADAVTRLAEDATAEATFVALAAVPE